MSRDLSKPPERVEPHDVVTKIVRNQSSRHGGIPRLIVLHDTEGANIKGIRDLQGLAEWFDNPAAQASSHVATDAEGNSARFVADSAKAWHCKDYNSASLGIEQVGFARQNDWPEAQLRETARWIARWSEIHRIPIRRGKVSGGVVTQSGVLRHSDLGISGGGHHDPGANYPLTGVLELACYFLKYR